ncbi:MAG: 1,4-dihydroxy-2-naphthoate polyprenyltransferase [Candidatus Symbiothrix sp.]|jgi:1,4-dihydroxy-2-naphthoate octaprenyltransferase|nr:1,4-dihydroxy-2-naphthoate polyprenyltransferase [Candidatus Symbiothrix sp.]
MVKQNSPQAWLLAARPKTLTAAATPVLVGCALAFHDNRFHWLPAFTCLLFALIAQIISNFANDYFDYKKGTDNEERLGPQRAVAEGWIAPKTMLYATLGLLAVDMVIGLSLLQYGGWKLIMVGALVALFAIAYSGGPYPLAYHGWGDVCVFIFFGIIPVGFTYYVQASQWTVPVTMSGIAVGLVIINILVANNYRDRFSDEKTHKKTTIILFGEKFGRYFYLFNGIIAVICCQYFLFEKTIWAGLLPLIYLLFHITTWRTMVTIGKGTQLVGILGQTARNVFIFGLLLSSGLLI